MELEEKIKKAESCTHCSNGYCKLDGYAPFDCENCKTYDTKSAE